MPEEMDYKENILETVGHTPLVKLNKVTRGLQPLILAKLEHMNPGGSVKDRIGIRMVEAAERAGILKPGGTIVECTSGNTGAGLAIVAAVKGYKAVFTMPDKMSKEKVNLLKAYGAEVIVTPTAVPPDSPESYYEVAKRVVAETPGAIHANQYFNPANPEAHYLTTGPEIWDATGGRVTCFVAGIGTGGTISGVGKYLKEKNPSVKIVGVDPVGSVLKDYFYTKKMVSPRTYIVEGIGEDIIPGTTHFEYIDEIISVGDRQSLNMARRLSREEGIFVGGSSGTAVYAAIEVAKGMGPEDVIVVLMPDTGDRYLSKLHSDEWMRDNRLLDTRFVTLGDVVRSKRAKIPALVTVSAEETVRAAIELIKEYDISQIPVTKGDKITGSLSDGPIMNAVLEDASVLNDKVGTHMEKPLPVLSADDHVDKAVRLFAKKNPAVVVKEGEASIGILTRFDLIEYVAA